MFTQADYQLSERYIEKRELREVRNQQVCTYDDLVTTEYDTIKTDISRGM